MKKLMLIAIVATFFASCSSSHKITTTIKKTSDSVVSIVKDTVSVNKEVVKNDNFTARGIDITINYPTDTSHKSYDTVSWKPMFFPIKDSPDDTGEISTIINSAVASNGLNGRIPTSISIHIDSLGNSTVTKTTSDSSSGKTTINSEIKTTDNEKTKDIKKTGLGFGSYIIIGIVVILLLVFFAFKFKIL